MTFTKSMRRGLRGVHTIFREERNMRIHVSIAILVSVAGVVFSITALEWALLALTIGLVVIGEVVNSIFERLIDVVKPSTAAYVADMKDMMAGAVVVAALVAVVVGTVIFLPHLIALW